MIRRWLRSWLGIDARDRAMSEAEAERNRAFTEQNEAIHDIAEQLVALQVANDLDDDDGLRDLRNKADLYLRKLREEMDVRHKAWTQSHNERHMDIESRFRHIEGEVMHLNDSLEMLFTRLRAALNPAGDEPDEYDECPDKTVDNKSIDTRKSLS